MSSRRDRDETFRRQDREEWARFSARVQAATSFRQANGIVDDPHAPRSGEPGGAYYSNLGFFLQHFIAPAGANVEEYRLYIELIDRVAPDLAEGVPAQVKSVLNEAIRKKGGRP